MKQNDAESEQKISSLTESITEGLPSKARSVMQAMHPAEVADALEALPPSKRRLLWDLVNPEIDGDVLLEVHDEVRDQLVQEMDISELQAATEQLDVDDMADLIQALPEELTSHVLAGIGRQDRARLEQLLEYPEDSAGGLMNLDTITVQDDVTLEVVLQDLRARGDIPRHTDRLWVVNRNGQYCGELPLRRLLTHPLDTLVVDITRTDREPIAVQASASDVARLFEDYDLVSAPVVDANNTLLGRVTVDDVVDVIRDEAEQSVMSMAGLNQEADTFAPVVRSARRRALWLGVNLLTALLASWVIAQFESTLDRVVTLAVLMSVVPSMGGIAGSQTLTLVIRSQALGQVNRSNQQALLIRELGVGLLNGLVWATIVCALVTWWLNDLKIGLILGAALMINLLVAAWAGMTLPILMKRVGIDPALAGGVALTTVTDVVGLLAFLGLATWLL